MKITERLNVLRELMKEKKIDAYLVPTDDFHGSEYVGHAGHGWVVDRWQILYSGGRSASWQYD